jgi:integrase
LAAVELEDVLRHLGEEDRRLFLLLSLTGLRISEALGLQWQDVEYRDDGPVLHVRRQCRDGRLVDELKTAAARRTVALVPRLAEELAAARPSLAIGVPIFASLAGGHRDSHNVRRSLRRATAAAGVPCATPHTFRHTFAPRMVLAGFDASIVAAILGHRDSAFTRRTYVHIAEVPRFDDLPWQ